MTNYQTAGFNLPHAGKEDKLRRVLSSALGFRSRVEAIEQYWDASYFGLDKVKVFQDGSAREQTEILQLCSNSLLEEAYFIEKAGVGYMAKMVTLAETTEERMLYALFSADEATHLAKISQFLPNPELIGVDAPFLNLLADVVESQDKALLLFVLQVVLEGWGLTHYRNLAKNCQNPELSAVFQGFLQDESRHHATGSTLFERVSLSSNSQQAIASILTLFLQMVQVGPQYIVSALEKVKGHLSRQQKIQIFEELDTENYSGSRLNLLYELMLCPNAAIFVKNMRSQGYFKPFSPANCVF